MADIEELGGLLGGEDVQWGEEALCFLDYATEADSGLTAAQIIPHRPPEPAPRALKNKRGGCEEGGHQWPVPPPAPCQPFIAVEKPGEPAQPLDDDDEDDEQQQESRTVGSRGSRSYASRMERKANREKMRRLELNDKFNELAEVLLDVEPCCHSQGVRPSSRAPTDKGNFRVELLSRAIRTLKAMSEQSRADRCEVDRLQKQLDALKLASPQVGAMQQPSVASMAAPADPAGGVKKSAAPMWVTVPVWMPQQNGASGGVKAGAPGHHQGFPMAMPIYMPQHHQLEAGNGAVALDASASPASSVSSVSFSTNSVGSSMDEMMAAARGGSSSGVKPLPSFGMPVFPPMPFMHPGYGPVTMVPPPQLDEQQEAPTHAPCA